VAGKSCDYDRRRTKDELDRGRGAKLPELVVAEARGEPAGRDPARKEAGECE
jgi:hypothetical protein